MSILPLPTTRISDYLTRSRLVQQTQSDQLDLFRLQNQISTGRRIFRPSEDGPSALRSIGLQRTLERKEQVQVNLSGAQNSLTSADNLLGGTDGVTNLLNEIRAGALGVAGTTATDGQRADFRGNVFTKLDALVKIANSTYQDSYLFAGSRSLTSPYVYNGNYVEYRGDETTQQQRVDSGVLFDVSTPGAEIFGGLSEPVRGTSDLNPQLIGSTRLSELNQGAGVSAGGSIEIAYLPAGSAVESESVTIDLSSARTIDDVARLIETGGPASADLRVSVTGSGLEIEVEPGAGTPGRIVVRNVAAGETATELGILSETPATTIAGEDLDPTIRLTTSLSDLQGTKAQGRLAIGGANNDLILTATTVGAEFNDLTVEIRDGVTFGNETATFTPGAPPTLVIDIDDGITTAAQIAAAINAETSGAFEAKIDFRDAQAAKKAGSGAVNAVTESLVTDGGGGAPLDLASGLLITNGEEPFVLDTSGAETVEDLMNLLNRSENGIFAELNSAGTGIDVRTRRSGADFSIGEGASGGQLATQLGIRSYTGDSRLEDFNRGKGVVTNDARQLTLVHDDGAGNLTEHTIDLGRIVNEALVIDISTVDELIDEINAAAGPLVTASLASAGNGIELTIDDSLGQTLTVSGEVAERLGFVAEGTDPPQVTSGAGGVLTSEDRNTIEVDSVFNSLLRLADALTLGESGVPDIGRAIDRLDVDLDRTTAARGEIGARLQSLDSLQIRLEDEEVELRATLSKELDVDLTQAISDFTARQFSLQASLQTTANLLQMSILNYI